jgi:hypothetical protein
MTPKIGVIKPTTTLHDAGGLHGAHRTRIDFARITFA